MNIVFHFEGQLPVKAYGGTERIVFWLMCELVRKGHKVTLIGHPLSDVKKFGIDHIAIDLNNKEDWYKLIPKSTDIIHLNYNHAPDVGIPVVNTVHGNGKIGEVFTKNSIFVSKKHAEVHGSNVFVHNAVDFSEYPFEEKKLNWDRFLFLAKASWSVKNLKDSVKTCRDNNKHLEVIGGRWLGLSRYIHNHGIIGGEDKLTVIRKCDALLFPVRWHEPFGIAIIEAMSQGLPVIGSNFGSLPELITPETGFIASNFNELNNFIHSPTIKFNSIQIRKSVEERFNISKNADEYLKMYQRVINGETLNINYPTWTFPTPPEKLLDF